VSFSSLSQPSNAAFTRYFRSAIACGLTLAATLNAGRASALDFLFTFTGQGNPASPAVVSGLITGLADNMNNQTSGITVNINSATNTPSSGWPVFSSAVGSGFNVAAGQIIGVDIVFESGDNTLFLGNQGNFTPELANYLTSETNFAFNGSTLTFAPVPSPLPLLGTAFAFRARRQLRRRLKATA
jgi:hypothetical protein